ncbi:chromosomal replication initiator protein DnaA [Hymenobacter busanensis]|uniref:Chromosomal replication initiator protein DnaA n=1 Tax=Hymenobacter busanensis TaxID=2607656 RepID=A0A7L5A257_9BACT|nr:chromosomal replication initiator protein DnaA [Hymenobacter busanensis]KAA9338323.1 chromosomal replication initiator protein DnaA [Hymenobacter busanensis]QHJ09253.1 chromosomal replication initiator protein DnaA [Hymenobacter busanensis]
MQKDCRTVWANCLHVIRANVGEQSFRTWFEPIVPVALQGALLIIQVPSQFFYEWLEEHYVDVLKKAIVQELGPDGQLEYSIVVDQGNEQSRPRTVNLPAARAASQRPPANTPTAAQVRPMGSNQNPAVSAFAGNGSVTNNAARQAANVQAAAAALAPPPPLRNPFEARSVADRSYLDSQLNQNYSFNNYIEGSCNRLARSAGFAVANKPGTTSFNPLMIYGGVGLGKTHLVQAIGNHIKEHAPGKFVLYVSAEKFTNQFIESLRNNSVQDFGNFYLLVDILILDDVQFLAGKDRTQEMFFHVFNHLHQAGKQVIMTSDVPPRELKGFEERLLSRFKWGLTADLQSPDFETRVAIIQNKMMADGIDIPPQVVEYLAYSVETNVRELEGVLISLIAQSSLTRREVDLEMAKQALRHIIEDVEAEVNLDFIQKTVAEHFSIPVDLLKAKTRKKEVVTARQVAMYFAKEHTNHSLKSIGYHFGGRDHSTVIHSVQTVSDLIDSDKTFRATIQELRKKFTGNK